MLLQFIQTSDILYNVLPSTIYVLTVTLVLHLCKPVGDLSLILFPNLQLI